MEDVSVVLSYCEIRVGVVVGRDVFVAALCLVCLYYFLKSLKSLTKGSYANSLFTLS